MGMMIPMSPIPRPDGTFTIHRADYVASKFAMLGLSEALDQEVGPAGIRVIALCPGTVNTEMMQRSLAEWSRRDGRSADEIARAHYFSRAALQRWVEPEDVAEAALFLASDAAAVTGAEFRVNAGRF